MKYDIDKLHSVQIEILDYFVSVCEEYGLCYLLVGGTALGAYRHKGFIPWDDDLDVGMPRADYQKFLNIMKSKNHPKYSIQNEINEENWFLTFSKIRKNDPLFIEEYADGIYHNNGIYIDIFPLDYRNNDNRLKMLLIKYIIHCLKFYSCKTLYKSKEGLIKYIADYIICFPVRVINRSVILRFLNGLCAAKRDNNNEKYIAVYDDPAAQSIPYDIYFPAEKITFEGKQYFAPQKITDYLTCVYGATYMKLPPVEQRTTHQPIEIRF